jgi:hypothetical protein
VSTLSNAITPFDTIGVDRVDEIKTKLAELDKLARQIKRSRRRFKMKAFLAWMQAREQHNGDSHGQCTTGSTRPHRAGSSGAKKEIGNGQKKNTSARE